MDISADNIPGLFEKNIIIKTNNKFNREFTIPITGEIVSNLKASPPQIIFGKIEINKEYTKEFIISSRNHEEVENIKIKYNKLFTTKIEKIDNTSCKVLVNFNPPIGLNDLDENIDFFIGNNTKPILSVPVYAKIIN